MPDLKAAARELRTGASEAENEMKFLKWGLRFDDHKRHRENWLLAAQALEAWAWQQETGASVREMGTGGFFCAVNGEEIVNNYYADTPLGAVLAAMEGERDGRD